MIKPKLCYLLAKTCDDYKAEERYDVLHSNFQHIISP